MNVSPDILRKETVQLIREIDKQIAAVEEYAENLGTDALHLHSGAGQWAMAPLLLAKATAYNTLVMLNEPSKRGR
jgi:hypothetical protein